MKRGSFLIVLAAIDDKHITIKAPPHAGSESRFACIVDANAILTSFDLGTLGSISDGGVFKNGFLERFVNLVYFLHHIKPYPHRLANSDKKFLSTDCLVPEEF